MRDLTNLSAALLDTLNVVLNGLTVTSSPTIVFSGDVDVRELTLNDALSFPLPWILDAKGTGYSNSISVRRHRSDSYDGIHAYAVALALSSSRFSVEKPRPSDRVSDEVRASIVEQLVQDAGAVVSPEGLLEASDVQLGRRLVIMSVVQKAGSKFAERFWPIVDEKFSGYDLDTIPGGYRRIPHAGAWSIMTKWGCAELPTG